MCLRSSEGGAPVKASCGQNKRRGEATEGAARAQHWPTAKRDPSVVPVRTQPAAPPPQQQSATKNNRHAVSSRNRSCDRGPLAKAASGARHVHVPPTTSNSAPGATPPTSPRCSNCHAVPFRRTPSACDVIVVRASTDAGCGTVRPLGESADQRRCCVVWGSIPNVRLSACPPLVRSAPDQRLPACGGPAPPHVSGLNQNATT